MKKIALFIYLVLFSVCGFAKSIGYGNTEWGMTPSQVVVAEKDRAYIIKPIEFYESYGKVKINNIEIGGLKYTAIFIFDDNDKLIQTNLNSGYIPSKNIVNNSFEHTNALLVQKYGKPQFIGSDKIIWKAKNTVIELKKTIDDRLSISEIILKYTPIKAITKETSNL